MSRLILIDGSGFIFRAYHAMPPLTNPQGVNVGAVYGFVNMVVKLLDNQQSDYVAVIFDAARKTFRNRIYPEYKAHRPPAPEDLIPQFPMVREATRALGLPSIELEDYEADDIIATYVRLARMQGVEVTIISSDKDLMQLIGDGVLMFDAMKNRQIGVAEVMEKFAVPPEKLRDVLALIGDSSDNVPGVPGIGPKTAAELINQYGNLENLLAHVGEIKQTKRRETIENNAAQARLSYQLIGLEENVPLPLSVADLALKPRDEARFSEFLQGQGFKSLLARIAGKIAPESARQQASGNETSAASLSLSATTSLPIVADSSAAIAQNISGNIGEVTYQTITTEAELAKWLDEARAKGSVAFDTETTSLHAVQAELVGFSLCIEPGRACYVPLNHRKIAAEDQKDLFAAPPVVQTIIPQQLEIAKALALLKPILEDEAVLKIGHNIKYDMVVMNSYGCEIKSFEDTMLLSYALFAGLHGQGMDELAERYLGMKLISYNDVTKTGAKRINFSEVDIEKATSYAAEDADITMRFYQLLKPRLKAEKLTTLYETIEKPLIPVIARMERAGIKIDQLKLRALSEDLSGKIVALEAEIKKLAGVEFNVSSPKQLGEVLFEHMGISGGKKSAKTGAYSTSAELLEELAEAGHVIAEQVLSHRALAKLKNTYCDTLPLQINPETGRIHTNYGLAIAATGRLSSSDPNLQNIPIRSEEGRKIREAFIADSGNLLLAADYSQIELRLLAHMADIQTLKEAFRNGDDIHAITASKVFSVALNEVNSDLRRRAKAINFGIIYGISAHGLSVQLGISRSEAAQIIDSYFATYPGIRDFMESCREFARQHGYVETLFKRRCHTPLINDRNQGRRQFAERAAINAPLQGSAADIIKRAMIAVDKILQPEARMLLQVHDELIFEIKETAMNEWQERIKQIMENAANLSVPLVVESGAATNWRAAH